MNTEISIVVVDAVETHLQGLTELLHACVHAGANIGFVQPFSMRASQIFWNETVNPEIGERHRVLLVAHHGDDIVGSVQLLVDMPPNQPHRAEVTKLLVHPNHRRKGIARALMHALEDLALEKGRSLITLDTRTGDNAEPLYTSLGYETVGQIPQFCLDPVEDRLYPTTVMFKSLA